jgi:hypothetical protein
VFSKSRSRRARKNRATRPSRSVSRRNIQPAYTQTEAALAGHACARFSRRSPFWRATSLFI